MTDHKFSVFKFEDIEVREREFLVVKGEKALPVEPKAFRVLLFLLRNPRKLVTKDEILNAVWDDCAVSDNSLTRSIATLRRLLGDDSREPRFIATVPTVGYRFLCNVVAEEDDVNGFATEETHRLPEVETNHRPSEKEQFRSQFDPGRKRLSGLSLAGLCILAVGIVAAGYLIRVAGGTRDVHGPFVPHLAAEERITSNPPEAPVENAVVSREGRYLAFHDNSGLYMRQIANGETRVWDLPKDFVCWPDDWFPDGTPSPGDTARRPFQDAQSLEAFSLGRQSGKDHGRCGRGICVPGRVPDRLCDRTEVWKRTLGHGLRSCKLPKSSVGQKARPDHSGRWLDPTRRLVAKWYASRVCRSPPGNQPGRSAAVWQLTPHSRFEWWRFTGCVEG